MDENKKPQMQYQLSNAAWYDIDDHHAAKLIEQVLERETWVAPRQDREPMTTHEQVMEYLATHRSINYDSDWYAALRIKPAPRPASPPPAMVKCSCGHSVPQAQVMRASLGTACPDCYDRLSY